MTCSAIASGGQFLGSTLRSLECAGQSLGEAGYQALAAPGSLVGNVLLAMLTLFIALQGARLMFGRSINMGEASLAAVKIGLVLMLATSWPAVRTVFYDTAIKGPAELLGQMGGDRASLDARLERIDSGMVRLTQWGTGKLDLQAGRTADGSPAATAFNGQALNDGFGLAGGRLFFLIGVIGGLGATWLLSGLLVSLLPLFAGFLLFDHSRGLALGWLRGWFFLFITSLTFTLLLAVEATLLEPWLVRVIAERSADFATPSAPIELMAMTGAFGLIMVVAMLVIGRMCFFSDIVGTALRKSDGRERVVADGETGASVAAPAASLAYAAPTRAFALSQRLGQPEKSAAPGSAAQAEAGRRIEPGPSGDMGRYAHNRSAPRRRASQRTSLSSRKRDRQ